MPRSRGKAKGGQAPVKAGKEPAESDGGGGASEGAAADMDAAAVLSPELMAELGDSGAGGALISKKASRGKGKKRGRVVSSETRELAANISKSKAKKLKQIEDKKAKDGRRVELYLKLERNRMSKDQLSLLQSSKTISMNQDTLRSRIKQAVQRAVAGIALSEDAVKELESHPGAVADVEEALALPVGGAMAAARRNNGSRATTCGEGGGPETVGKEEEAGKKLFCSAVKGAGRGNRRSGGGATKAVVAAVAASAGGNAAADALSSKKRVRYAAVPAASPKPTKRIQIVKRKSSTNSTIDTSKSDGSDSSDSGSDGERENGVETSTPGEKHGTPPPAPACAPAPAAETTAQAGTPETESAATSGSSWAAKMMSSMARLPTSGSTSQWGALASGSSVAGKKSTVAAEPTDADADEDGGDEEIGPNGNADKDEEEEEAGTEQAAAAPAVPSYPPPPSWLEGKAPVYHAVETPLPSTSGEISYRSAANRGGGGSGSTSSFPRPERWVPVKRSVALQAARMQLPVCGMEQEIMEAVHDNDAVILCGETGSGKSTQVPQFLYEAGYAAHGLIGVTQPRRVATVGTAERVAVELGTRCGEGGAVAYQIRYDASGVGPKTRVKFMTDGVLLQEITSDLLLRKYSVVLLDEAHERNLNTDVLLGMLSRSIPLRKRVAEEEQRSWDMLAEERKKEAKQPLRPLKLVIMSATLRVTDFTENPRLFPAPPPVISATSRQHPVTVHFSKKTELYDYAGETFKKVCKIHQRLPEGGILVFLTGKREILHMCDKLRREFPPPRRGRRESDGGGRGGNGGTESKQVGAGTAGAGAGADSGADVAGEEGDKEKADHGGGDAAGEEAAAVADDTAGEDTAQKKKGDNKGDHDSDDEEAKGGGLERESREGGGEGERPGAKEEAGSVRAAPKPPALEQKPREADREALLYREADDDEEDAARLADMEAREDEEGGGGAGGGAGAGSSNDGGEDGALSSGSEAEDEQEDDGDDDDAGGAAGRQALPPVHVVPLYAMLTAEEQATVFLAPPEGHRLVVVATNVAETSITIPGIAYVVDCGRQKRRVVQRSSGISKFEVGWVSKASADQRAGRAGRTGPGHCYRLYSSALYTQTLESFAPPEVLTRPLEDVMLQMKAMGVVDVSRFPFPTPPDATGLRAAAALLSNLGATTGGGGGDDGGDDSGEITAVGKALALLPVGARYAKMLLLAVQGGLLAHAAALVAMLTEGDPFVRPESAVKKGVDDGDGDGDEESPGGEGGEKDGHDGVGGVAAEGVDAEEVRRRRAQWLHPTSDALARLKAAGAYAYATSGGTATGGGDFCRQNFLHRPTMDRSLQLRRQLSRLVDLRFGTEPGWKNCDLAGALRPPSRRQSDALRQVLLSGLLDHVARRAPAGTVKAGSKLFRECAYLSCNEAMTEPLYIKSTSVLFSRDPLELPEWVVYQDIVRGEREGAAANMTCVTAIEPGWIAALAEGSPLLSFSEPLVSPPPTYDGDNTHAVLCRVTPRYGVHAWELPPHLTELASAAPKKRPDMVFRWFARLLLEGGVAGCLAELKGKGMLNDPPSLLTREMPTKKVAMLVLELRQKGVCSLPALAQQWRREPAYLKSAVELWIKLGYKQAFEKAWVDAIKSAVAALSAAAAAAATAKAAAATTAAGGSTATAATAAATTVAGAATAASATAAGASAGATVASGGGGEGKTGAAAGPADAQTGYKRPESGPPREKQRKKTA
eukprot:g6231.t1